jgi:hypothetical protein
MAAKKTTTKASTKSPAAKADKSADAQPAATPVVETRFSNVPPTKVAARPITEDDIRTHAYFISISGQGGSEFDNWCRAENELRSL